MTVRELDVVRVQNWTVHERVTKKGTPDRVMFHGCKSAANEEAICTEGFRIDRCRSMTGRGAGTWFASNPSYSHNGFAFQLGGWMHLFMCLVSRADVRQDDGSIRVVGSDCAYPLYILCYR
eukprot:TRINITY_DN34_c0_g2_i2.p2 TRINITY_DN34_c0_g2~~TRINITY_DN34_c0_g2_i2.p2  ORF type:complete len:121 (+),score=13.00 TRINITY_DN34_c0_g2_i2:465-827(+)